MKDIVTVPAVMMFVGCLFITISFFAIVGALCEVSSYFLFLAHPLLSLSTLVRDNDAINSTSLSL